MIEVQTFIFNFKQKFYVNCEGITAVFTHSLPFSEAQPDWMVKDCF